MRIEINLAPGARSRPQRPARRSSFGRPVLPQLRLGDPRLLLGFALVSFLLLAALGLRHMERRSGELAVRIEQEVADSARHATSIALLQSLQARQDTLVRRIEVIRSVDDRRYIWPHLLDEIALALPPYTWLTQLSPLEEEGERAGEPGFVLQGKVGSTPALTRFMKNLQASAFIQEVALVLTEQEIVEGRSVQHFQLEARFRVPEPYWIETVPLLLFE